MDASVTAPAAPESAGGSLGAEAITAAVAYSLVLAACGGVTFWASVSPALAPGSLGFGWAALLAALLLAVRVMWVALPAVLLVLGLVHLRKGGRLGWLSAAAWVGAVAAATVAGWQNLYCLYQWNGVSAPYWHALIAAAAQLAAGAAMIVLIAPPRRARRRSLEHDHEDFLSPAQ